MKAIRVRYHGATNTKPSRYTADDGDGNRISLSAPHMTPAITAAALCLKMKWRGKLVHGTHNRDSFFVFLPSPPNIGNQTITVPDCSRTQGPPPGAHDSTAVLAWLAMRKASDPQRKLIDDAKRNRKKELAKLRKVGEMQPCPACDGDGIRAIPDCGDPCERCNGTGWINL